MKADKQQANWAGNRDRAGIKSHWKIHLFWMKILFLYFMSTSKHSKELSFSRSLNLSRILVSASSLFHLCQPPKSSRRSYLPAIFICLQYCLSLTTMKSGILWSGGEVVFSLVWSQGFCEWSESGFSLVCSQWFWEWRWDGFLPGSQITLNSQSPNSPPSHFLLTPRSFLSLVIWDSQVFVLVCCSSPCPSCFQG